VVFCVLIKEVVGLEWGVRLCKFADITQRFTKQVQSSSSASDICIGSWCRSWGGRWDSTLSV